MAKRRKFTPEFKAEVVLEVLSGATSQAEVCRRHNPNENQLSQWKRQLLENASTLFESTDKQSSEVSELGSSFIDRLTSQPVYLQLFPREDDQTSPLLYLPQSAYPKHPNEPLGLHRDYLSEPPIVRSW